MDNLINQLVTSKDTSTNDLQQNKQSKPSKTNTKQIKHVKQSINKSDNNSQKTKKLSKKENKVLHGNDEDNFDDDDDDLWDDESDSTDNDEDEIVLDEATYSAFLNQIFPSKFSKEKAQIKAQEKEQNSKINTLSTKNSVKNESKNQNKTKESDNIDKKNKKSKSIKETRSSIKSETNTKVEEHKNIKKPKKKSKLVIKEEYDTEDEDYEPSTEDDDDSDEYSDEDDEELENELLDLLSGKGLQKFNIVFTIGNDEYSDEYSDEDDSDEDDSDEDDDDEYNFDNYTKEDYERDLKLLKQFNEMNSALIKNHKNSTVLNSFNEEAKNLTKAIEKYRKNQEKGTRKTNMKKFKKIISGTKKFSEKKFFAKLSLEEQSKILKQIEEINILTHIDKPYKFKLLETEIPLQLKACAMKKIEMFRHMDQGMSEYYKLKNWIDTFMEIPFGKYKQLPITIDDGIEKCRDFMTNAKNTLDNVAFGLDDAKMQIIQMIGTWITNPEAIGTAIAIQGPPGTGKTTLVKEGISKILGRDFAFIALGGATDSSYLEGHGYTYEGSKWGKIVDILVQSKSMNPIIYFDELDKISDTPKGEEIIGILTHLTDTTQNNCFHDKYFSEIEFDLSKCLFIFSYNDESKINPILKDRMYRIYTQGYEKTQKQIIAREYLLPKIRDTIKFSEDNIIIDNDIIDYINMKYVEDEKGVRNMKRCLEIIYTKLNLYRFIDSDSQFFEPQHKQNMNEETLKNKTKITFPLTITKDIVDKLLNKNKLEENYHHLYL